MESKQSAASDPITCEVDSDNYQAESEAFGVEECETYSNYRPVYVKIGKPHPHQLCEGSALSCVKPPPITYELKMAVKFYETGDRNSPAHLSNAQLEAIIYACQSHQRFYDAPANSNASKSKKSKASTEKDQMTLDQLATALPAPKKRTVKYRQGFFLGDGTGTGKSRAGIIFESEFSGMRQILYVTASAGLFETARQEILNFLPNKKFLLIEDILGWQKSELLDHEWERNAVLFITYKSMSMQERLNGINKWLQEDFDGLMIFDEAHYAKSAHDVAGSSAAGRVVDILQKDHPKSRVVYSTARSSPSAIYEQTTNNWHWNSI
ncbi:unnamed protein product [Orchesella dallaii]|uniref:Strawberry notch AAA domain-containing protein n=1 Tax=Orchesella dallaii TaxID=48710 RepID=A0ABP1SAG9_9HEXA